MVRKSLGTKPRQQPLREALFEVQVNCLIAQYARVLEYHRADRSLLSPIADFLIPPLGNPQCVQGGRPARIGAGPTVERRQYPSLPTAWGGRSLERGRSQ